MIAVSPEARVMRAAGVVPIDAQQAVAVTRDEHDAEAGPPRRDCAQLVEEVRFLLALDAVVEVDVEAVVVAEPSRHAQERRDADAARDPELPVLRDVPVREGAVRALDHRLGSHLEPPERTRVVADAPSRARADGALPSSRASGS
jgi:hypothetical protein